LRVILSYCIVWLRLSTINKRIWWWWWCVRVTLTANCQIFMFNSHSLFTVRIPPTWRHVMDSVTASHVHCTWYFSDRISPTVALPIRCTQHVAGCQLSSSNSFRPKWCRRSALAYTVYSCLLVALSVCGAAALLRRGNRCRQRPDNAYRCYSSLERSRIGHVHVQGGP